MRLQGSPRMHLERRRKWQRISDQRLLLEYSQLRQACPAGIYLTLTPGDPTQWSGVFFVRKGPYAPAVLRFEVVFPLDYPEYPPTVRFTSDIFHPLVAPLTAYTYFVGTSSTKPVSAGGDASLAPGAFNLPNKFSTRCRWSQESAPVSTVPQTIINRSQKDCIYNHRDSSDTPHPPNPALDASQKGRKAAVAFGVRDILEHIKQAFDDEKVLDDLPAEAAANPGAWKAWKAHRQGSQATLDAQKGLQSVDNHSLSVGQGDGWNWDGVWHERVQKGIKASISDPVLYGSSSIGDPIRFAEMPDELLKATKVLVCDMVSGA